MVHSITACSPSSMPFSMNHWPSMCSTAMLGVIADGLAPPRGAEARVVVRGVVGEVRGHSLGVARVQRVVVRADVIHQGAHVTRLSRKWRPRHAHAWDNGGVFGRTHKKLYEDTREFMREMMLRMEKVTDDHSRAMDEVVRELQDLRAESRAQRQALLQVIDRMDRLDPGGASA